MTDVRLHASQARPVVLVTGAAKRVGKAIAQTLHAAGYDLALHYRNSESAMVELCAELEAARADSTLALHADLSDIDRLPQIIDMVSRRFGRLDGLVNNASSFYPTPLGSATPSQWDELFASNAKAPFFLAQAATTLLKSTQGSIVNIVDIYAAHPLRDYPIYSVAKAALGAMTLALASEMGPDVRVNGVAPGAILWPEKTGAKPSDGYTDQSALIARSALKRMGTPQDVAAAVLYLMRDARFISGQILNVDGGRSLET